MIRLRLFLAPLLFKEGKLELGFPSFQPSKPTRARPASPLLLPETCFFQAVKIVHFGPSLGVRIFSSNLQ
jgi:hypothetical protein